MQFNSDSNLNDIVSDITEATKMDLNEYPIEDRTRNANHWYFRLIMDVVKVVRANVFWDGSYDGDESDWAVNTADGSAVRNLEVGVQEYQLPTGRKPWLIYKVAIMLDGSTYFTGNPFHIAQVNGNANSDNVQSDFSVDAPVFRVVGDKIVIVNAVTQNVVSGLKIWYVPEPVAFTVDDTAKIPEINVVFHKAISLGASYEKLRGKPKGETILRDLNVLRDELKDFYTSFLDKDDLNASEQQIPSYK